METLTIPVASVEAVTDLVMNRQLIEVQRDHAKGIVAMVLGCAAEVAGPREPVYEPNTRRLNVTIKDVSTLQFGHGFSDHVGYTTGWDGKFVRDGSAYGPPRNDEAPTGLTSTLQQLVGHNVALWVTDDEFFAMPTIVQVNDMGVSE
ncbi:hypothetical protein [Pseudarthrobacter sp. BIM B-2242]|uniref:hypothetical protein n=1 Tax=Pseudarthrobacter sp. BIM B-2242 TaxID=2772401 RepID=UPI00168AC600|nr:hypothetical protein [Pseudarthrobacter sp. BIM B-2242]QOD05966.1 hypothetical protein IDT60_20570 [Pseudarthrobacter sp. BIM B-2242]